MQNSPNSQVNEVLNTIRRMNFDDVLSVAQAKGGAINDPTFNINIALKELDKKAVILLIYFQMQKMLLKQDLQ